MLDVRTTIQIGKAEVLAGDVSGVRRILNSLLALPNEFERNRNNVAIYILGYDDDPQDLYHIPEVRAWFHALFEEVPELFYWINMNEGFLTYYALMMCRPVKVQGGHTVSGQDIQKFLLLGFERLNRFCAARKISPDPSTQHITAIYKTEAGK